MSDAETPNAEYGWAHFRLLCRSCGAEWSNDGDCACTCEAEDWVDAAQFDPIPYRGQRVLWDHIYRRLLRRSAHG